MLMSVGQLARLHVSTITPDASTAAKARRELHWRKPGLFSSSFSVQTHCSEETLSAYVYFSEDSRAGRNCKKEPTSRQGKYCSSHFSDESFHFPLKVFLAGSWSSLTSPTSYMCPFGSSYLPLLLLIACGYEQQF